MIDYDYVYAKYANSLVCPILSIGNIKFDGTVAHCVKENCAWYAKCFKDEPQTEPHECVKTKKKPCSACKYYDWEVDEHIGFREVCYNIGNCEFKKKTEPQTERPSCETCRHKGESWSGEHCYNCYGRSEYEPQPERSE